MANAGGGGREGGGVRPGEDRPRASVSPELSPTPADGLTGNGHLHPLHAGRPVVTPAADEAHGFGAVLRRRDFRFLWAAQAASQLADKFLMFSLLVAVYDLSRLASAQSFLMIAYTLPSVLLSAPAGVYADRHDKRALMLATNLLRGGLILLIPLAQIEPHLRGHAWPLILVTFFFSSAGQVFAPAEAASIPSLVRREQLTVAMSLFMTTVILTLVLGVPLATVSIRLFGTEAPFFIAAGLFGIAALSILRVGTSLRAVERGNATADGLMRELRAGMAILGGSPPLRLALVQLTIALIVVFTVFALGPPYMETVLHRSDQDTYLVLIPATLGLVAVAALLGQHGARVSRRLLMVGALVGGGGTLTLLGVGPPLLSLSSGGLVPLVVALAAVFGCALGALLIPAFAVLQERTDEESRGRIFGGIFTVINAAVALPLLLAGTLADLVGVEKVVAGLGLLLIVGAAFLRGPLWARLVVLDQD